MRKINYKQTAQTLLTPEIVSMLMILYEYKGKQERLSFTKQEVLDNLTDIAKIQSTEASNKIEGIYTSDERLEKLVKDKTIPRNRNEQEIAGYRDVLKTIHENYQYIPLKDNMILQLHKELYEFCGSDMGGHYKISDNIIAKTDDNGRRKVRFEHVPAGEKAAVLADICKEYNDVIANEEVDPLFAISIYIIDFLCIHPFNDGNGRMSRLLTLLLLYKSGFDIGKYISIEKIIERTKDLYYSAIKKSSACWHEGTNDYKPFVGYILGTLIFAYRELEERINIFDNSEKSKPSRVAELIENTLGTITKTEIMKRCPGISQVTIQRALNELFKSGKIIKIGGGRYTQYVWNREQE